MKKRTYIYKIGLLLMSLLLLLSIMAVAACGKSEETVSPTAVPTEVKTATPAQTPTKTPTLIIVPTSTPTSTPTATSTIAPTKAPTPVPTFAIPAEYIAEKLVLIVEPSQPRVLNLSLKASDSAYFVVDQVTPSDVPFGCTVTNPYNEVILNLEKVKAPGFSFDAVSSGTYTININISPILFTNAVIILEVYHRGPAQFPAPTGIYIIVEHGKTADYNIPLTYADRIQGSLTIEGGDQALYFSFLDPSDNIIGPAGRIAFSYSFSAKVNTSGQFTLEFNNVDTYTTKLVTLQYTVFR